MTGFSGMFELHMVTLVANSLPAFRFQTLDDLLAVHGFILHTNTHRSKLVFVNEMGGDGLDFVGRGMLDLHYCTDSCDFRGLPDWPGVTRRPNAAEICAAKRASPKAKFPFVARRISSTNHGSSSYRKSSR